MYSALYYELITLKTDQHLNLFLNSWSNSKTNSIIVKSLASALNTDSSRSLFKYKSRFTVFYLSSHQLLIIFYLTDSNKTRLTLKLGSCRSHFKKIWSILNKFCWIYLSFKITSPKNSFQNLDFFNVTSFEFSILNILILTLSIKLVM